VSTRAQGQTFGDYGDQPAPLLDSKRAAPLP
jgi:hypothetical protein